MPDVIGAQIDRLISVELKNRGMPHDIVRRLYDAARAEAGGRPLSIQAAEGLVKHVGKGDVVLILTGAGYPPPMPKGESDGPPGAAALARALYWGLGAVPVYVCEQMHVDPIVASSEAAALMVKPFAEAKERRLGAALAAAPTDQAAVAAWAQGIVDRYKPKALIAVERLGPNAHGVIYNATGQPKRAETGIVDLSPVVLEAARAGAFSIGFGDHGNEIGFGRIHAAVEEIMPYGRRGQAETPGGSACAIATDVLIPCMMSNWGAYGLEAALAFLLGRPELMHTPAMERNVITRCLDAGGLEAMHCSSAFVVDNCQGESSMAVVQLLGDMVRLSLQPPDVGVAH
jgi:hypothetical protein